MADQVAPPTVDMPGAFGQPVDGAELIAVQGTAAESGTPTEEVLLGLGAETWVYISVSIFFVLAVVLGKLPQRIAEALDERILLVRRQLDEARLLREEAQALLADARVKADAASRDAAAIVAQARVEAQQLVAESEKSASDLIARRTSAAEDKIAAAERGAEAELRGELARRVTAAAAAVIKARADKPMHDRLTDEAIAGLEKRLH